MAKDKEPKKPAELARHQKFRMEQIHRSMLNNAPYNPRTISDKAKKKLRTNLKKVGLIEPLIWNKTTGNLVGGHQRIAAMDSLEKTSDYLLDVAVVELDEKTEKEQNIFLNNGEAQGEWDLGKLESLYRDDKLDIESTGFDTGQIYSMLGSSVIEESSVEEMEKAAEKLRDAYDMMDKTASENTEENPESDASFYAVVVFKSHDERVSFQRQLGLGEDRYIDGRYLVSKLGANGEGPDIAEDLLDD